MQETMRSNVVMGLFACITDVVEPLDQTPICSPSEFLSALDERVQDFLDENPELTEPEQEGIHRFHEAFAAAVLRHRQ